MKGTIKKIIIISIIALAPLSANPFQSTSTQTNLFPNITGNAKIDSLNSYAFNLAKSNLELRLSIGEQCYDLSKLSNYELGLAQSLNNIGASLFHQNNNDSALVLFKNAFYYASKAENRKWKIETTINIAEVFSDKHQFDSSLVYYKIGMTNAVKLKDSVSIALLYNLFGFTHWRKGGFTKAIRYYKESLKIYRNLGNNKRVVTVLNNLGSAYYHLQDYQIALEYYIEARDVRTRYTEIASPLLLNNIGLIYLKLDDLQLAASYFKRGLKVANETNHILGQGYSFLNIGDLNDNLGNYNLALEFFNKSIPLYEKLNDLNGITKILNRIGQIYLETDQLKLAKNKFLEAYRICKDNGLRLTQTVSLINFVKIQIRQLENYEGKINSDGARKIIFKAKRNLDRAHKFATEEDYAQQRLEIYKLQSRLYVITKNFEPALIYYQKYNNLKDSLFNEQSIRIITNTKEKYESEKNLKINNHLRHLNQVNSLRFEAQEQEKSYIAIALFFFLLITAYLIYLNNHRKKRNLALLKAKKEVEETNLRLNETNALLQQANSTKDKFFSIISHDLKNPFNTLLGASQILNMDDGAMDDEEKKELIEIISNDSQKLYSLLENLLFWANSQTGNLKSKKVKIDLYNSVFEIVNLYKSSYTKKNIQVEIDIPKEFAIIFDKFMFSTVIRNLLSNAIKFSYYDSKISFVAIEKNNRISLLVKDYGVGIKESNLKKIFDESSDYRELGTNNEKGTGLGLILCRDFANENNASLNVTSKIDKGTTFELLLEKTE